MKRSITENITTFFLVSLTITIAVCLSIFFKLNTNSTRHVKLDNHYIVLAAVNERVMLPKVDDIVAVELHYKKDVLTLAKIVSYWNDSLLNYSTDTLIYLLDGDTITYFRTIKRGTVLAPP